LRRRRREPPHGLAVARGSRVVREPVEWLHAARRRAERSQRLAVQPGPPIRRERFLDGQARELVAKLHGRRSGSEHPRGQAFLEALDAVTGERFEQPQLGLPRLHGDRLEQRAGRRRQACHAGKDGVAHALRYRLCLGPEHLRDEKRISAGRVKRRPASTRCSPASSATASSESGSTRRRSIVFPVPSSPSRMRNGWSRPRPSSR